MNVTRRDVVIALLTLPLALALWYAVFALDAGSFWVKIALSAALLALISLGAMGPDRSQLRELRARDVKLGLSSAVLLYIVFWAGRGILTSLFSGAETDISSVYTPREGTSPWLIAALLLLVTGPCEEIYWRGLLQRVFVQRIGPMSGLFLATGCYALAHIWTLNVPLMLAAFTAGLVWGWIYLVERRLLPVIISHSVWSVIVFVVLPLA